MSNAEGDDGVTVAEAVDSVPDEDKLPVVAKYCLTSSCISLLMTGIVVSVGTESNGTKRVVL